MKEFLVRLACMLAVLAVLGYFLYPVLYDQYSQSQTIPAIEKYHSQVKALSQAGKDSVLTEWRAINSQASETDASQAQTVNGMVAVLEIPEIGLRLPVYPKADAENLKTGAALKTGSQLPTGDDGVQIALVGADGLLAQGELGYFGLHDAQLFRKIDQIPTGSLMYLFTPLGTQAFLVEAVREPPKAASTAEGESPPQEQAPPEETAQQDPSLSRLTVTTEDGSKWATGRRLYAPQDKALLAAGDVTQVPPDWASVLLLGSPVLLVGLVFMNLVELIRRRHYRLPNKKKKPKKSEG